VLVVVDGRRPVTSIGLTRSELCALLLGLGATDAILFDSGGSATLVARARGDSDATVHQRSIRRRRAPRPPTACSHTAMQPSDRRRN